MHLLPTFLYFFCFYLKICPSWRENECGSKATGLLTPYLSSVIPHPSSRMSPLSPLTPPPLSLISSLSSLIPHPFSLISHHSSLLPYTSSLFPQSSSLTPPPIPSPLLPHPVTYTPPPSSCHLYPSSQTPRLRAAPAPKPWCGQWRVCEKW